MSIDGCKKEQLPGEQGPRPDPPSGSVTLEPGLRERQPHDPLCPQWTAPPLYLYVARIKVWGPHIKQGPAFDVDENTNIDLSGVVTAYLFPLVIHLAPC